MLKDKSRNHHNANDRFGGKRKEAIPFDRYSLTFLSKPMLEVRLLHLCYDSLESFGVVDCEVSQNLAVDFDSSLVEESHKLRIAQALKTCGSIDTLNPQCAEIALLVATVTESVGKSLLPSILGYGPNILACAEITSGQTQNLFSPCS